MRGTWDASPRLLWRYVHMPVARFERIGALDEPWILIGAAAGFAGLSGRRTFDFVAESAPIVVVRARDGDHRAERPARSQDLVGVRLVIGPIEAAVIVSQAAGRPRDQHGGQARAQQTT